MPDLANLIVFPAFLVFCRLGAAIMVFPGFSDPSVNPRVRLLLAMTGTLLIWPMVEPTLPNLPDTLGKMMEYMTIEIIMGILIAIAARLFMSAMNVAGEMIAFATGFQAATLFDPISNSNSTAISLFLMVTAGVLIFATNLHHVLIEGVIQSYQMFPPGNLPKSGDALQAILTVIQNLFVVGLKIAAPVVTVGFLSYVAFGIFNRLIPQLHVFFVALPVSIVVGMFVMASVLAAMLTLFTTEIHNNAILFTQQG
ncbi:MAG: flagellar biosynthetic protein FliR [Alphaproteobacteria bacterium]|nr:flagellar biosynthetic protein FliR [Alphaproteobacteria bacterium]MDD9920556.1 flagellar biosynthetic protein FliR [Alphaproteobacteria bacterium]